MQADGWISITDPLQYQYDIEMAILAKFRKYDSEQMLKIFNWCKTNADINIMVSQDTDAFVFTVAAISKTLFTLTIG